MIRLREVEVLGTRRRIRAIRYLRPDGQEPDLSRKRFKLRQPGYGTAHRREQYDNPAGTWTIDRIPVTHRELFTTVLDECLKAA